LSLAVKRAVDVMGSVAGLVLLSPVMAGVALALLALEGRPVLFRQLRPGRGGVPFRIVKFRTMRPLRPGEPAYRSDEARVTRLGRLLRVTSLDELPELWNVLRGEMSLVGPRPLLMEYLEAYTAEQARRHLVRPGVTGWAVVNGRHALRFHERIALDVWYVDHWSLGLDARILLRTLGQVVARAGVSVTEDVDTIGFPLPPSGGPATGGAGARGAAGRRA
jgi:lipopolysaccharide/colanic/teichoic acid biosynthesis glycosyltransferase